MSTAESRTVRGNSRRWSSTYRLMFNHKIRLQKVGQRQEKCQSLEREHKILQNAFCFLPETHECHVLRPSAYDNMHQCSHKCAHTHTRGTCTPEISLSPRKSRKAQWLLHPGAHGSAERPEEPLLLAVCPPPVARVVASPSRGRRSGCCLPQYLFSEQLPQCDRSSLFWV